MDMPPVKYARTPDNQAIAYLDAGQGTNVLFLPFHHNHIERRWTKVYWVCGLAETYRVVHYDSRGQGLSSRGLPENLSADDYGTDLEAVIAAAGIDRFVIVAYGGFAHVALRYAVDNPERVLAIVLICTSESFADWPLKGMLAMAEENWDLFLELETASVPETIRQAIIGFLKISTSQADYIRMVKAFSSSSITDLLGRIHAPVLMLHSLSQHWLSIEDGSALAAKLGNARLVFLDGRLEPDDVSAVHAIQEFLGELNLSAASLSLSTPDVRGRPALSARQEEILRMLALGRTTREIAADLVLSERTVERHIAGVYAKIGVRNRVEAANYAQSSLQRQT